MDGPKFSRDRRLIFEMQNRKRSLFLFSVTIVAIGILAIVVIYKGPQQNNGMKVDNGGTRAVNFSSNQTTRIRTKSERCPSYKNLTSNILYKYEPRLLFLPEYNMTVCRVDKAGGTFLKKFMTFLRFGAPISVENEPLTRLAVHKEADNYTVPFHSLEWRKSSIITAARNPYTRLYSAYVDKVLTPSVAYTIRRGDRCFYDVSFEEFLKIVIHNNDHGLMDTHWTPIYYLCRPCEYQQTIIIKQETFKDDMKLILDEFNISKTARDSVSTLMGPKGYKWAIQTAVRETMIDALKFHWNNETLPCIGWLGILQKLWKAFQIQGYINVNVPLYFTLYNKTNQYSDVDTFLNTVFDAIERYPITKDAAKYQKSMALREAYRNVSPTVIKGIERVFAADFDLFGYSLDPPM